MRKAVYLLAWKETSGSSISSGLLLEVAQIVDQIYATYDLDFVWLFFLSDGFNFEDVHEFVHIKNKRVWLVGGGKLQIFVCRIGQP